MSGWQPHDRPYDGPAAGPRGNPEAGPEAWPEADPGSGPIADPGAGPIADPGAGPELHGGSASWPTRQPADAHSENLTRPLVVAPTEVRRSTGLIVTVVVLALAFVATAVLAGYLWRTTDAWQAESARLDKTVAKVSGERDTLAADLDQTRRDLAATDEQLSRAQDRITALADEKARTADEREYARQLATAAAGVAGSLEECVYGQDQLINVLSDLDKYDPETVVQYAESVRAVCNQALENNDELKDLVEQ